MDRTTAGFDQLTRFWLEPAPARGVVARLEDSLTDAFQHHQYPPVITHLLKQLAGAAVLLASNLKQEGQIVLQAQGDGRVPLLCVEATNQLTFRCYAQIREGASFEDDERLSKLISSETEGRFVLTIRPKIGQMYQGIIALESEPDDQQNSSSEVVRLLERYLSDSQQTSTRLWLREDGDALEAMLLERLPEQETENTGSNWETIIAQAETTFAQPFMPFPYAEWLQFTFADQSVRATDPQSLKFACACSHARVLNALKLVGEAELRPLVEEHGHINTQCEFCGKQYQIGRSEFAALFTTSQTIAPLQAPGSSSLH